jgi:NAD(P)-dependent dehydrogenase (short-subunit alcohol dehydrogenase family)
MTGGRDLTGTVAVVTGAARGLGEALALRLAARGARLALVGLEPALLADVAARCGADAASWEADVTDGEAMATVAQQVADRFGRVDVVVANAGIAVGGPLLLSDPASFDRVIEVNLLGSVRTARAFLPHLVASKGYLLQVASLAAITPAPLMAAYCASKSGVEAFAHSLAGEVGHHGVGVGVAYLSWTDTDMVRGADEHEAMRRSRTRFPPPFNRTYPLGPAADRLVDGSARRDPHVYGQAWVRGLQAVRGLVPGITWIVARREMPALEADVRSAGVEATLPVGAGGAADAEARRR